MHAEHEQAGETAGRGARRAQARRWRIRLLMAGGGAIAVLLLVMQWQERGLDDAQRRLLAGDPLAALERAETFLASHPDHGRARALRARALVALGRAEEAAAVYGEHGAASPADLRAWSTALLDLKRWHEALPVLERVLDEAADPALLEAVTVCRLELGRYEAALDSARRLAAVAEWEAQGHLLMALIYQAWGSELHARGHFAAVLEHRPGAEELRLEPVEFFLAYASNLLAVGNARQALELLEQKPIPHERLDAILLRAEASKRLGRADAAGTLYEQVLWKDPQHTEAREMLAEIALQQGRPDDALGWLEPFVRGDQRVGPEGAFLVQRAYTALGDDAEAVGWHERCARLRLTERRIQARVNEARRDDPQGPRARLMTAYQAAYEGDWSAARQLLAALLRDTPEQYRHTFVQALVDAVQRRGPLPPLEP